MKLMGMAKIAALTAAALFTIGAAPNWNFTVGQTEGGGHRLGNPEARVKLIEFVSYTCPHCAAFQREADAPMRLAYVARGLVSVEVRHLVRDPVDLAAAVLANCGPKEKFFLNHAAILRGQDKWLAKAQQAGDATRQRWISGPFPARMRAIADDVGFYELMATRGYARLAVDKCLSDENAARRLAQQSEAGAAQYEVKSTPSFVIDGILLSGTHDWGTLQPQIAARL